MSQYIHVVFTARPLNPISWLIRWMIGPSKLTFAKSSHGVIIDGENAIEANMVYGVRCAPRAEVLKGLTIVREAFYAVPDAEAGLAWYRAQACRYEPTFASWVPTWARKLLDTPLRMLHSNYDWMGDFGMAVAPDRNWQSPGRWSCYEGCAGALKNAGLDVFSDWGFVSESTLWSIKHAVPGEL